MFTKTIVQRAVMYISVLTFIGVLSTAVPATLPTAAAQNGNPFGCVDGEVFISAQEWWTNATGIDRGEDGRLGDDFGHIHTELCFPHMQTVTGEFSLNVRSVMHDNPGEYEDLIIELFDPNWNNGLDTCGGPNMIACVEFEPARTMANCEATGGNLSGDTCVWNDRVTIDTTVYPYDGWQQIRIRSMVTHISSRHPDQEEMGRTSTGLHVYFENGNRRERNVYEDPNVVLGRGWYTGTGYGVSGIDDMPQGPVSGTWRPDLEMRAGADGIAVTTHIATLNPNFHMNDSGDVLTVGSGGFRGRLPIDTTRIPDGWHKLALKTNTFHPETGSTNTALTVIGFEVRNNNQAPDSVITIEPPGPIDIAAGETLSIPIRASNDTNANITLSALVPGFASFQDQGNGQGMIQASPGAGAMGMHVVQVQAEDSMGGETTKAFQIIVSEDGGPNTQIDTEPIIPEMASLVLVNADNNQDIGPLSDGAVIDLSTLPSQNLAVRADTEPQVVGSVRFDVNGQTDFRTESVFPYAMTGDDEGILFPWPYTSGPQTITATAFERGDAEGIASAPMTVNFTLAQPQATEEPTPAPTEPPSSSNGAALLASAASTDLQTSGTTQIDVILQDPQLAPGGGVYAVEAACTFSNDAITASGLTGGSLFGPDAILVSPPVQPGSDILYAVSQSGTNLPVSTGGTLFSLAVNAQQVGEGVLNCDITAVDAENNESSLPFTPVSITVADDTVPNPTTAPTMPPEETPTPEPTADPTDPPAATEEPTQAPTDPVQETPVPDGPTVVSLSLLNSNTAELLTDIRDGDILNLSVLPQTVAIRAETAPDVVGSVAFDWDGDSPFKVESIAPYALVGDSNGTYNMLSLPTGTHSLAATAYTGPDATGEAGPTLAVTFEVIRDPDAPAIQRPNPEPTPTPPVLVQGTLEGLVQLSHAQTAESVTVTVTDANDTVLASTSPEADGSISMPDMPDGTYTVEATSPGYLPVSGSFTIEAGNTVNITATLLAGETAPGDPLVIDELDVITFAGMYGQDNAPTNVDFNRDGRVTLIDLRAIAQNIRASGPLSWQ